MSETTASPGHHTFDGRMRGSNQSGLRAHNERAVLSLIRRHGKLAKAEIARHTGLSPQTASVIMRALESEQLVLREMPRRGRIGQPSIPMRLNPDGAFSLGLKIGRRSADLVLMDFVGRIRARETRTCAFPRIADILDFVAQAEPRILARIDRDLRDRVAGLGVAMPFELWSWGEEIGAPSGAMDEWRDADILADLCAQTGHGVHVANDATAACAAENVFGETRSSDYLYFYVGAFVGGGMVIDGDLVSGRTGNAAALGSMPIPREARSNGQGGFDQLINFASLHVLEKMVTAEGGDPSVLRRPTDDLGWDSMGTALDRWLETAAHGLAYAVVAASSVYDFECTVIDGSFPPSIRDRLVEATRRSMNRLKRQGLTPVEVRPGTIGTCAREIGAASLPFFARFLMDHRVLYAETGGPSRQVGIR